MRTSSDTNLTPRPSSGPRTRTTRVQRVRLEAKPNTARTFFSPSFGSTPTEYYLPCIVLLQPCTYPCYTCDCHVLQHARNVTLHHHPKRNHHGPHV
ncbi:hypothetical protein M405DRAFT_813983 [Rhizopogon salebrosus TDB-379]|nr:hypothetical protein M405DRAFT_813983 [Rhizopogon salebrosus TDB-379]